MKKSLIVLLILVFSLSLAGTAFAAGNFVDVPTNHWAYASVNKLVKAGLVDGMSNGNFNGDKAITRYEMAIIVGKAMDNYNKADDANKAEIMKLVAEFAKELDKMGLRIAALEKSQSPISFSGSADVRYTAQDYEKTGVGSDAKGQYRLRLNVTDKLDDNSSLGFRILTATTRKGTKYTYASSFTKFGAVEGYDSSTSTNTTSVALDRVFVTTKFGEVKATVGAQPIKIGLTDAVIDSDAYSFDGVRLESKLGQVALAANIGRFEKYADVASLEASTKSGALSYGAGYLAFTDNAGSTYSSYGYADKTFAKYVIANVAYAASKSLSFGAEYVNNQASHTASAGDGGKDAEIIYALVGDQKLVKTGDSNWKVSGYKSGKFALSRWSNWDLIDDGSSTLGTAAANALDTKDTKGYNIKYTYALGSKLTGYLMYEKITDDQATSSSNGGYEFYRVGLTAKI